MSADPITAVLDLGTKLVDKFVTSDADKASAKLQLLAMLQNGELGVLSAQAGIVKAEAESESWLTCNWRPLTMMTFVSLIVARMFGWTAPGITEAEYLELWGLINLGIGGYVVGRSAEKVLPTMFSSLLASKR